MIYICGTIHLTVFANNPTKLWDTLLAEIGGGNRVMFKRHFITLRLDDALDLDFYFDHGNISLSDFQILMTTLSNKLLFHRVTGKIDPWPHYLLNKISITYADLCDENFYKLFGHVDK